MKKQFETIAVQKVHIHWVSGEIETVWMFQRSYDALGFSLLEYGQKDNQDHFTLMVYCQTFEQLKEGKELEAFINMDNIEKVVAEYQKTQMIEEIP